MRPWKMEKYIDIIFGNANIDTSSLRVLYEEVFWKSAQKFTARLWWRKNRVHGKYSQNHMAPTKYLSSLRRKSVQVLGLMPNRFTITMHEIKKSTASLSPFLSILAYSAILWRSVCMFHLPLFQLTGWGERDTHRYQLHFSFQHSLK